MTVKKNLLSVNRDNKTRPMNIPRIVMCSFLIAGLVGIITTSIVDFALNRSLTWSFLPISAIVFSWICVTPLLSLKKHSIDIALLFFCIFILPFLKVICVWMGGDWFSSVAIPMSMVGLIILWLIRVVFSTIRNTWNKLAVSLLIGAAGNISIAFILAHILFDGSLDVWNLLSVGILIVTAVVLFVIGRVRKGGEFAYTSKI